MRNDDLRQTPTLLVEAFRRMAALVQGELHLARAEVSHNMRRGGVGLAFFGIAAVLALTGLDVLAAAIVAALVSAGISAGGAALIVGCTLLIVAVILVVAGKSRMSIAPSRTARNIRRDVERMAETLDV